jgi:hypothetical protein
MIRLVLDRAQEGRTVPTGRLMKDNKTIEKSKARRRSSRILMRVPLIVNVVDASTEMDWEPVQTITVSKHGAMIRAHQNFQVGAILEVRVRDKDRSTRARVAWKSTKGTPQGVELGFEILDEDGFWEITFPPDRWSKLPKSETSE